MRARSPSVATAASAERPSQRPLAVRGDGDGGNGDGGVIGDGDGDVIGVAAVTLANGTREPESADRRKGRSPVILRWRDAIAPAAATTAPASTAVPPWRLSAAFVRALAASVE